ncbi:MAG TPA: amidohydrolase family protein [bacterium]|nr:amidohydrolase family protein [bacterium]HPR87675.1 amidohydrolase family protein [bacterium]
MKTSIHNGTLVFEDHLEQADLLIEEGRIAAIAPAGAFPQAGRILDATSCAILPGFIDLHTHIDDVIGGKRLADTWRSGSQIALQNGITTLCSFITQGREESLSSAIARGQQKAAGTSFCDYGWHLTPTRFDAAGWREIEAAIGAGFSTFKFYTTYREAGLYSSYAELEERIGRLHSLGGRVLIHCEDDAILERARQGEMAAGIDADLPGSASAAVDWSDPRSHARVRPAEAEVTAIRRLIEIARRTGAQLHIVHVSTPEGAAAIRQAGEARVTCETCPQYLFLDESWLGRPDGRRWICAPPLRPEASRRKLAKMVRAGGVDCLATDHCAFTRRDKESGGGDIRCTPGGVAGIGALVPLAFRLYEEEESGAALIQIARQLAAAPARVIGHYPYKGSLQVGADADLVVLRSGGPERSICSSLADAFETYPGMKTTLAIRALFLRGRLVVENGEILEPDTPGGAWLCQK